MGAAKRPVTVSLEEGDTAILNELVEHLRETVRDHGGDEPAEKLSEYEAEALPCFRTELGVLERLQGFVAGIERMGEKGVHDVAVVSLRQLRAWRPAIVLGVQSEGDQSYSAGEDPRVQAIDRILAAAVEDDAPLVS